MTLFPSFLKVLSKVSISQKCCVELALVFWPVSLWLWAWNRTVLGGSTILVAESRCDAHTFSPPTQSPSQPRLLFSPPGLVVEIRSQLKRTGKEMGINIEILEVQRLAKTSVLPLFSRILSISPKSQCPNPIWFYPCIFSVFV